MRRLFLILILIAPLNVNAQEDIFQTIQETLTAIDQWVDEIKRRGKVWFWDWSQYTTCDAVYQQEIAYQYYMEGADARSPTHYLRMDFVPQGGNPDFFWDYEEVNESSDPPFDPYNANIPRWVKWRFSVAWGNYTMVVTDELGVIITSGCLFVVPPADEDKE